MDELLGLFNKRHLPLDKSLLGASWAVFYGKHYTEHLWTDG